MSDLIRREDALEAIVDERTHTIFQAWINVKNTVPSVDAIEVVRCKECKHRDKHHYCGIWGQPYLCNDECFCSYGERGGK